MKTLYCLIALLILLLIASGSYGLRLAHDNGYNEGFSDAACGVNNNCEAGQN